MFKEWPDLMSKYISQHDEEAAYSNTGTQVVC